MCCFNWCAKCCRIGCWFLVFIGVLFLLKDLGTWDFWGINWWTAVFLYLGIGGLSWYHCKACQTKGKKKK